jgi:23S rRNA pseudouridine1911/1915/1917 synthase
MSDLGHPIVADWKYVNSKILKSIPSKNLQIKIKDLNRIALHAAELGFVHPTSSQWMTFQVPWPLEMNDILTECVFE